MGKSFASLKRQVTQTRKRSKERGGGEVGRLKREALYAHMRYVAFRIFSLCVLANRARPCIARRRERNCR